jgi:glutamyl/glutaminyl-tRNA synthetase
LYEAFGWEKPIYIHVSMVLGSDGNKLSKRNGDSSFMDLYEDGYLPKAIVNYLVLLGWSPESNEEIFTMEELIKIFNPKRINKSPSTYDVKKLQWFNALYMKKLEFNEFKKLCIPFLEKTYDLSSKSDAWINHLLSIYQNHISYGKEIIEVTKLFFVDNIDIKEFPDSSINKETIDLVIKSFKEEINDISDWTVDSIKSAINKTKDKTSINGKELYMPIRVYVSGFMHGPELPDTIYLLGKDTVLGRLKK